MRVVDRKAHQGLFTVQRRFLGQELLLIGMRSADIFMNTTDDDHREEEKEEGKDNSVMGDQAPAARQAVEEGGVGEGEEEGEEVEVEEGRLSDTAAGVERADRAPDALLCTVEEFSPFAADEGEEIPDSGGGGGGGACASTGVAREGGISTSR